MEEIWFFLLIVIWFKTVCCSQNTDFFLIDLTCAIYLQNIDKQNINKCLFMHTVLRRNARYTTNFLWFASIKAAYTLT